VQLQIGSGALVGKQIFPIGYSATYQDYTPALMDNQGTTNDISIYMVDGVYANGVKKTTHVVNRSWYVSSAGSGYSVNVTLTWHIAEEDPLLFDHAYCHIGHATNGKWDADPGDVAAARIKPGSYYWSVSRGNMIAFSPIDVEDPQALPITLIEFTAKAEGKKVRLDWVTGSEENNDFFTVERSIDGKKFEKVFAKDGAGNSKTNLYYFGYDNKPYTGISYYRLKQTDFDGKFVYSDIISVNVQGENRTSELNLRVYPNPVSNQLLHVDLHAQNNATYTMCIINEIGQQIFTDTYDALVGNNNYEIHLPNVVPGMYVLEIKNDKDIVVEHVKIIIDKE